MAENDEVLQSTVSVEYYIAPGGFYETEQLSLYAKVIFFVAIIPAELCNIVGNSCILIAMIRDKKVRTPHNFYIANLAITDLIVGLISIPFSTVLLMDAYYWRLGHIFCKIFNLLNLVSGAESLWTIVLITYDRLQLVKQGALYAQKNSIKSAVAKIVVSWFWVLCLCAPPTLLFDVFRGYSIIIAGQCYLEIGNEHWYPIFNCIAMVFFPASILFVLSWYVFIWIRHRNKKVHTQNDILASSIEFQRRRKATRSLVVLVAVFLTCWMPFTTCLLILPFCRTCVSAKILEAFNWLLWMNSSVNPSLYAATIPRFRQHFRMMLLPKVSRVVTDTSAT